METPDRVRFDKRIQMHVAKREQVLDSRPMRPVGKGDMKEITKRLTAAACGGAPSGTADAWACRLGQD